MAGIIGVVKELYIRLMVWLGAAPPADYNYLIHQEVGGPQHYTLKEGDSLFAVARKFRVHYDLILKANGLESAETIQPGRTIVIPHKDWDPAAGPLPKPAPPPVETEAPTEPKIAEPVTPDEAVGEPPSQMEFELEPPPAPVIEAGPPPPEAEMVFRYTVQRGDTINSIARKYGVTIRALVEANDIVKPDLIFPGQKLIIPGYMPSEPVQPEPAMKVAVGTEPSFPPLGPPDAIRGLYVSYFAIGHPESRQRIFELLAATELNAVVIDAKGDDGLISYPTGVPVAHEIGAAKPTARDFEAILSQLKANGIYTIARVVTFKDHPLARNYPEYALKTGSSEIWLDRDQQGWGDPFLRPVWDYNIQVALEAAQMGFDEIQFNYVRFPMPSQSGSPQFSQELSRETRIAAVIGFLSAARGQLKPFSVKVGADIFGYSCWRKDDTLVGQDIGRMAQYLDVLSPMLYPSTFGSGIPGYKNAAAHPYEVVYESARRAVERTAQLNCAIRPWIQDFPDYRFDKRVYGRDEIQAQIKASFDAGSRGFMVWNPHTKYSGGAYAPVKA